MEIYSIDFFDVGNFRLEELYFAINMKTEISIIKETNLSLNLLLIEEYYQTMNAEVVIKINVSYDNKNNL